MEKRLKGAGSIILIFILVACGIANADTQLEPYVKSFEQAKEGLTLWQMIKTGGFIMIVLAVLSVIATAIIAYNFITLRVKKLAPGYFAEEIIRKLRKGDKKTAKRMCELDQNIFAGIVKAGLEKKDSGDGNAKESMENCVRKELDTLWQSISYLIDIAGVAPLLGLLGTVLGMIQAFNVIAFQTAVVKPILLAAGISKAMITTVGGLTVAIPIMLFYAYFRGKIQKISNIVESYSIDIIKIIDKSGEK